MLVSSCASGAAMAPPAPEFGMLEGPVVICGFVRHQGRCQGVCGVSVATSVENASHSNSLPVFGDWVVVAARYRYASLVNLMYECTHLSEGCGCGCGLGCICECLCACWCEQRLLELLCPHWLLRLQATSSAESVKFGVATSDGTLSQSVCHAGNLPDGVHGLISTVVATIAVLFCRMPGCPQKGRRCDWRV